MKTKKGDLLEGVIFSVVLLVMAWVFVYSVNQARKNPDPKLKYKAGDVVYLKPDSLKVVVTGSVTNLQHYHVEYTDNLGNRQLEIVEPSSVY